MDNNNNNNNNNNNDYDNDIYSAPSDNTYAGSSGNEYSSYDNEYNYSQTSNDTNNPKSGTEYIYDSTNVSSNGTVPPSDGNAISALVCGILSIALCSCYGILGLALGIIAIVNANIYKRKHNGKTCGISTAGLVTGIVGVSFSGFYFLSVLFSFTSELLYWWY